MPSVLIMAGGVGERFWPASTTNCPKQFLPLTGNLPMILETIYRVKDLFGLNHIYIITTKAQLPLAKEILSILPTENIITEPEGRNTAPCLVLGVAHIKQKCGGDEVVAVLPSDHYIRDTQKYQESMKSALDLAEDRREIITYGIKPDRPETGYGYIAIGSEITQGVYQGLRFVEKPDYPTAEKYVRSGLFLWNSGMLIFQINTFVEKLKNHAPQLYKGFLDLKEEVDLRKVTAIYGRLPKTSIDYALMEKLPSFLVIPGTYGWDDLGTWRALETTNPKDNNGNISIGPTELIGVSESIIYTRDKLVAAIGVKNLVIVQCENATLVCAKDRLEDVKKIVEKIKIVQDKVDGVNKERVADGNQFRNLSRI